MAEESSAADVAGGETGVLLALYNLRSDAGVDYRRMAYTPRRFAVDLAVDDPTRGWLRVDDPGPYAGWDLLTTYNANNHRRERRADWLEVKLHRSAAVALVWRGGGTPPHWLRGWSEAAAVTVGSRSLPTFRTVLPAGTNDLGAVFDPGAEPRRPRDTYWLLLAEAAGRPSTEPAVPAGRERPQPNETCPAWLHDRHVAVGPDGVAYPTWHPQIDPTYWCYHRHEHGSDPAAFAADHAPLYGYAAAGHGMEEPHQGFKSYVLDDRDGHRWLISHHFGTAGPGRACARFHTLGIAVRRRADGELLADLHFMADYGRAVVNVGEEPLRPTACPDQAAAAAGRSAVRKLPVWGADYVGYEPWRFDARGNALGLIGSFTINTPDTIGACADARCDAVVTTRASGSYRFLTPNDGFALTDRGGTGTFYTDALGSRLVGRDEPGALRQYVRAGIRLRLPSGGAVGHYRDLAAWGRPYVFSDRDGSPTNREGSIRPPN